MKDADVKKIDAAKKSLQEVHKNLETLKDEWSDQISELEEKDTDSSNEKAEILQTQHDALEEVTIALNEVMDNLEGVKEA